MSAPTDLRYDSAALICATGTGNSRRVAGWFGDRAADAGATVSIRGVEDPPAPDEIGEGPHSLLGLFFPTHGFTAPWSVLACALRLPSRHGTHAVVMPTRAGVRIWSHYLPGLEGTGAYLVALILALKGYRVRGVLAVDMPSNWTVLHPAQSADAVSGITARGRARTDAFADRILSGDTWLGGLLPLALGLLLSPASLAYLAMGRFFLAKLFFASDACTGCGQCARECPRSAIRMRGGPDKKLRPYWTYSCESCIRCMSDCPTQAVEAGYSFGVAAYFLAGVPVAAVALDRLTAAAPALRFADTPLTRQLLQYGYRLFAIWLTYLGLTLLLRVPLANRFFTLTTPTHYYRRYRAP